MNPRSMGTRTFMTGSTDNELPQSLNRWPRYIISVKNRMLCGCQPVAPGWAGFGSGLLQSGIYIQWKLHNWKYQGIQKKLLVIENSNYGKIPLPINVGWGQNNTSSYRKFQLTVLLDMEFPLYMSSRNEVLKSSN